jgi:hypothetical protein
MIHLFNQLGFVLEALLRLRVEHGWWDQLDCDFAIKQWVATVKNDYGFSVNGPVIGDNRNYGAASVHAPN